MPRNYETDSQFDAAMSKMQDPISVHLDNMTDDEKAELKAHQDRNRKYDEAGERAMKRDADNKIETMTPATNGREFRQVCAISDKVVYY